MAASDAIAAREPLAKNDPSMERGSLRQWMVLLVVCFNTGLNAYIYMNTSAAPNAFKKTFHMDDHDDAVGQLFSYFLITVLIGMTPGMFWSLKCEGIALGFSVVMNVLSGWLRYLSALQESYTICLISTLVNAAGAWTILSLPAQISQQRFKPSQWTLTTSMAVQANYFGWLVGALIPAQTMRDAPTVKTTCLVQAIVGTPLLVLFFLFYRPVTQEDIQRGVEIRREHSGSSLGRSDAEHGNGGHSMNEGSFGELFRVCLKYPLFPIQVIAYGALGGVSFAQPSATESILETFEFDNNVSSWVNVCFIGAGVLAGLIIGKVCNNPQHFGIVLKSLFILATAATALSAILCKVGFVSGDSSASLIVMMVLAALAGATSLGFIGIGIEAAAAYPAGAGYACWFIEILIQGIGGGLGFVVTNAYGFITLGSVTAAGCLLILIAYRRFADEN